MTGQETYDLVTQLLGGREFEGGDDVFYQILNEEKAKIEYSRPWMILRAEDSTKTATPSDTYTTAKTLPERFIGLWGPTLYGVRTSMFLTDGDDVVSYQAIPLGLHHINKNSNGKFYVNLANNSFYLCGNVSKNYTINLMYLKESPNITNATSWIFPSNFHPILGAKVAMRDKGEIDYDAINERMVSYHRLSIKDIEKAMIFWDDRLQRNEYGV